MMVIGCSGSDAEPVDLAGRLATMEETDTFTMAYRAAGTDVLDCVQPNRSFAIDVADDRFVVRDPGGSIVAERDGERLRLHRALFNATTTDAEWIEVALRDLRDEQAAALRRALGPDLAGYLLAADPPTSAFGQAASLVPLALSIDLISDGENDVTRFRLALDPSAYADASGLDVGSTVVPPLVDISVTEERVTRVVVRPAGDEAAGGWTIDFADPPTPVPDEPSPGSSVDLDDLDAASLRAAPVTGCAVGDETPDGAP